MSVTIIQTPEQFTPGYNEQIFVTSGTTAGKNNYQYIFNIYNSSGTKIVPSIKIPPRPTDSWAVFDAGRIIEAYLASDIAILPNGQEGFKTNDNSYYAYTVKVGEEFDISTTGVTSYPDQVTSSGTINAWNAAYPFQEFHDYNPTARIGNISPLAEMLTSIGDIVIANGYKKINFDENEWLYGMVNSINTFNFLLIITVDPTGNGGVYKIANPFNLLPTSQSKFVRVPAGTRNLNKIPSSSITIAVGALPIIKSTTTFYEIGFVDASLNSTARALGYAISETYLNECSKYDSYRLHFLNKYGGFDSVTFDKISRVNEDIERKQYKKLYGSTTGRWSYNNYDRGIVNYNTSIKDKLTLNSNWITEAEAEWLEQLVASPEIYWDNNDELWAVNITNTQYEKKKMVNDLVFNLTIEVEISQKRFTQRG